jgi:hypothetical protein
VRRFLRTLSLDDVSCAERTPEIHVVPEFPRRTRGAPAAERRPRSGDRSTPLARRGAWGAAWAVGDALALWWLMSGSEGHGLRGGSFTTTGAYLAHPPVRFRLRRVRFVPDLAVSGTVDWSRRESKVTARLRLDGAVSGSCNCAGGSGTRAPSHSCMERSTAARCGCERPRPDRGRRRRAGRAHRAGPARSTRRLSEVAVRPWATIEMPTSTTTLQNTLTASVSASTRPSMIAAA